MIFVNSLVSLYLSLGAPDLVLDIDQLERSIRSRYYLDRLPLYYLQCAQEEGCLSVSSSASGVDLNNERYGHTLSCDTAV